MQAHGVVRQARVRQRTRMKRTQRGRATGTLRHFLRNAPRQGRPRYGSNSLLAAKVPDAVIEIPRVAPLSVAR